MTYERVVVAVKTTGPDPLKHLPVEVSWWDLSTGKRGTFVPPHDVRTALSDCHLDTVEAIGYLGRLAKAPQDELGSAAYELAEALHEAVLVSGNPLRDELVLRRMYSHYMDDFQRVTDMFEPTWYEALDVRAYAAGVLGLPVLPDLARMCELCGVPLEAVHTAETDADALGRCVLRLAELADSARTRATAPNLMLAPEEMTAALAARIDRAIFDVVQFTYVDGEANPTFKVDTALIGSMTNAIYGPIVGGLRGELGRANTQLQELVRASQDAANQWQAKVDDLTTELQEARTLPPLDEMRQQFTEQFRARWGGDGLDGVDDGAAEISLDIVGPWLAAQQSQIKDIQGKRDAIQAEVDKLDKAWHAQLQEITDLNAELERKQASREAWATEALDLELARETPWNELVVPNTELSIGPDTADGPLPVTLAAGDTVPAGKVFAVGPHAFVLGPAASAAAIVELAQAVSPVKGDCPNTPGCEHPGFGHDIEDYGDPVPMCGVDACDCGRPPGGWRRATPMRVWQDGDIIPADVHVMDRGGLVWPETEDHTAEWTNHNLGPVVEVERTSDLSEAAVEVAAHG